MALNLTNDKDDGKAKKSGLNRQLGGGGKYPSKTTINLLIVEKHAARNAGSLAIFGVFLIALAVFTKFMVVDKLVEINQKEAEYNQQQNLLNVMIESNGVYDKVRAEYSRFGNSYLNEDEANRQDRMKILKVIEDELLNKDALMNISVSENVAELTINSDKLSNVSEIVAELESNPLVEYVTVSNSATDDEALKAASEQMQPETIAPAPQTEEITETETTAAQADADVIVTGSENGMMDEANAETLANGDETLESVDEMGEPSSESLTEEETEEGVKKIVTTTMTIYFKIPTEVSSEALSEALTEAETGM